MKSVERRYQRMIFFAEIVAQEFHERIRLSPTIQDIPPMMTVYPLIQEKLMPGVKIEKSDTKSHQQKMVSLTLRLSLY